MAIAILGLVGIGFSIFFASNCDAIWLRSEKGFALSFYGWWFHFIGSLIGWGCAIVVLLSISNVAPAEIANRIGWQHFVLLSVAFAGTTDQLPHLLRKVIPVLPGTK